MHPPTTSLNLTTSAEKSLSILVKTFFFYCFYFIFGDHLFLGGKNVWISEKSLSISVKTFYFIFFLRPPVLISVKTFFFFFFWRPPGFGRKKRLNFRFRPKNHHQFRWRHPNFWGFVLKIPSHQNFLDPPLAGQHTKKSIGALTVLAV